MPPLLGGGGYSFVSFAIIILRNQQFTCLFSAFSLYKFFEKTRYVLKVHTLCIVCTW